MDEQPVFFRSALSPTCCSPLWFFLGAGQSAPPGQALLGCWTNRRCSAFSSLPPPNPAQVQSPRQGILLLLLPPGGALSAPPPPGNAHLASSTPYLLPSLPMCSVYLPPPSSSSSPTPRCAGPPPPSLMQGCGRYKAGAAP